MPENQRKRGQPDRSARAAMLKPLYLSLGAERSIDRVYEITSASGLTLHRNTIARYSRDFGWVEAAREWDEAREGQGAEASLDRAVANDIALSEMWQTFRKAVTGDLGAYLEAKREPGEMRLIDLARVADLTTRNERLIGGEATERIEVWSSAMRVVVEDVGPVVRRAFERLGQAYEAHVRPVDDSLANLLHVLLEEVMADFGAEADRIVDATFRAQGLLPEQASVPTDTDDEEER